MQRATADVTADPLIGQVLEGRYRIQAWIARGGMSTVYAALDERLDRRVAVKVMSSALSTDPAFADRFSREARAAARLSHMNVVAVHDQGSDAGHVFLVMELVSGRTLRDLLRERGRLSQAQAVSVMEPVLAALAAAHRAGLVHRDIKPENILLSDDGVVKVADFGLARALDTDASATRTGLMMGTVAYCAPEQVSSGAADQRSDIYACGVVLFELLTGSVPYAGDSAMAVAYQHVHSRIPAASSRVRGVDDAVDDLIIRATDPDPAFRPRDGAAMLAELHDIRDGLDLPITPVPPRLRRPATGRGDVPDIADGDTPTQIIGATGRTTSGPGDTVVVPTATAAGSAPPRPTASASATRASGGPSEPPRRPGGRPTAGPGKPKRRRRRIAVIVAIILALLGVAVGYGAWWFASGRYTAMPSVAGEPFDTASAALRNAGFHNVTTKQSFDEVIAKGSVVGTSPRAGSNALPDQPVTIIVSSGQERYRLPDVHGMAEAAARVALAKLVTSDGSAAVTVAGSPQANDTVPKGQVIGTDPPAANLVKRNSNVTLLLSTGPPLVAVPNVTGQGQDAATNALKKAGFKTAVTPATSDTVATGMVIGQNPAAGDQAPKQSNVTITVSQGPDYVGLPSVSGKGSDAARKAMEDAGFKVKINKVYGGLLGLVVGVDVNDEDKNGNGKVKRGSTVTLDVA